VNTEKTPSDPQETEAEIPEVSSEAPADKAETRKSGRAAAKDAAELKKAQAALVAEKDKYLRILAEYDNFRKRSQKERESVYGDVRADTVMKFLPVYDNLERALKQESADEAYSRGVEMIFSQFKEIMEKLGVAEIPAAAGESFNPEVHEAVMHVEDEAFGEGVIAEEFQKGFVLGDRVIRCSVVKVAN
jgi:molecular chaperone GrpE